MKPFNAADPAQVKRRQDKASLAKDQRISDLKELLELPAFRRYIWRHINETCHLMQSAFNPNGTTQTVNVAYQDVAKALWAEIEQVDYKAIPLMMIEWRENNDSG